VLLGCRHISFTALHLHRQGRLLLLQLPQLLLQLECLLLELQASGVGGLGLLGRLRGGRAQSVHGRRELRRVCLGCREVSLVALRLLDQGGLPLLELLHHPFEFHVIGVGRMQLLHLRLQRLQRPIGVVRSRAGSPDRLLSHLGLCGELHFVFLGCC